MCQGNIRTVRCVKREAAVGTDARSDAARGLLRVNRIRKAIDA